MAQLINVTKNHVLAKSVIPARGLWERMRGLLGRESLENSEVMWIVPCSSIHTFFMKFPIDAVFVDRKLNVISVHPDIMPNRTIWPRWGHHSVFEFKAGTIEREKVEKGDQLYVGD